MCHHELWPTSVSHPFSFLNSSLGLAGGKYYQKITIPIFRLVHRNFAIPGYFPYILFYHYLFSLLSSGWFVIAVCVSISVRDLVISPVSEGSGDVMVLRRSRPPPAARNGVNAITQKPRDGLFSNLVYTLVVIVS